MESVEVPGEARTVAFSPAYVSDAQFYCSLSSTAPRPAAVHVFNTNQMSDRVVRFVTFQDGESHLSIPGPAMLGQIVDHA